jgi:hypothetical protein
VRRGSLPCRTRFVLHPAPYSLHLKPCALHPAPFAINSKPDTASAGLQMLPRLESLLPKPQNREP